MAERSYNILHREGSEKIRICRIYTEGWDHNIAAWQEEVAEDFDEICRHYYDNPNDCKLVGEAKWVWLGFNSKRVARVSEQEFDGATKVTMVSVHRKRKAGKN